MTRPRNGGGLLSGRHRRRLVAVRRASQGEGRASRGDPGAGSVLLVTLVAVVLSAATCALGLAGALVARQRAEAAADLAALAGAQALVRGGDACGSAGRVTSAGRARMVVCRPAGSTVLLVVEVALPGILGRLDVPPARARARAGVPRP
ncbi:MAG TPA: Rv3654c family TadE-like protein [Actinomycetes bacterium]|nr:Rv3654c family TadE-like protein [Actinomycetes bacterium]